MNPAATVARLGGIAVRALAALQPRDFREQFGDTVIAETAADLAAAVPSGTAATVVAVAGAVTDTARGVLLERAAQLTALRRTMYNALLTDLRQTIRSLRRDRGFTAVALSTLSAGLAMCVIVTVLVNAYLWRSLPYPEAHRLYNVEYASPAMAFPAGLDKVDWQPLADIADLTITWDLDNFSLRGGAVPEVVQGTWVAPDYMAGFGVRPAIGRVFDPEDYEVGRPMVAVISHRLWQSRFNADPAIVGKTFEAFVNDRPNEVEAFRVIGVLGPGHWHMHPFTDVMAPLRAPNTPYMIRLRDGVPPSVAAERVTALVKAGATSVPPGWKAGLLSTHDSYVEQIRPLLLSVASATGLVLLIACANVSVLLTVRATRRQREHAVRQALGASSGQLTRLTIAEPVLLGAAAVAVGLGIAWGTLAAIAPIVDRYLGRPAPGGVNALSLDPSAIAVTVAVGFLVVVVCAIVPAWVARRTPTRLNVSGGQKGSTDGPAPQRARSILIALEVAACLTLLAGAGLTIQSALRMLQVDMGLSADNVVVGRYNLRPRAYPSPEARGAFHARVLEGATRVPDLQGVAFTNAWPLQQSMSRDFDRGGAGPGQVRAGVVGVTPGYFEVLRIPMFSGRTFNDTDRVGTSPVVVISRTFATRLWPHEEPVGQTLRLLPAPGAPATARPTSYIVAGVVGDIRHSHTDTDLADVYVPLLQTPSNGVFAYLRVSGNPSGVEREFQRLLASLDADVGFAAARPLADILQQQRAGAKLLAWLLILFAFLSAILALVGIYGVIAYTVKQREREIAVRIAIGADRRTITRLFMRQGLIVLGAGLAFGIGGAIGLGRILRAQLFNVPAADPVVLALATLAFALCGTLAIAFPARSAASLDPASILKE
jgi:putative ABC transport system permease protein